MHERARIPDGLPIEGRRRERHEKASTVALFESHPACGGVDRGRAVIEQPLPIEPSGETAHAIAALFRRRAVAIVDLHLPSILPTREEHELVEGPARFEPRRERGEIKPPSLRPARIEDQDAVARCREQAVRQRLTHRPSAVQQAPASASPRAAVPRAASRDRRDCRRPRAKGHQQQDEETMADARGHGAASIVPENLSPPVAARTRHVLIALRLVPDGRAARFVLRRVDGLFDVRARAAAALASLGPAPGLRRSRPRAGGLCRNAGLGEPLVQSGFLPSKKRLGSRCARWAPRASTCSSRRQTAASGASRSRPSSGGSRDGWCASRAGPGASASARSIGSSAFPVASRAQHASSGKWRKCSNLRGRFGPRPSGGAAAPHVRLHRERVRIGRVHAPVRRCALSRADRPPRRI